MAREIIEVPVLSQAIRRLGAPTSALVRVGGLLFTCGMPPLDLKTGEIVTGDGRVQTQAALDALEAALRFGGSSLDRVVKASLFVTRPEIMADVNAVYRERFAAGFPARTSAIVRPWPLPFDIEIECVAEVG